MNWVKCSDRLPPLNKYVLGYYCRGNWHHSKDDPNREVVMRVVEDNTRNPNSRNAGYGWSTFGPMHHFAADISHWCEIPPAPGEASVRKMVLGDIHPLEYCWKELAAWLAAEAYSQHGTGVKS